MKQNRKNKQDTVQEALTECEIVVMKAIWESEEIMSIQEITSRINSKYEKDWKMQTVSTFLSRAVKKGYLEMKRNGRSFDYYPLVTEEEYGRREIVKCVEDWGSGRLGNLIASFAESRKLSEEEKDHIRRMLDDMD